ncbi:N-acetylmuramoyl-L-alanine amidase [Clostridium manihotivorum]|uniref:N-acetylmuramoyl-L-alanine amidase n=2 Tax=Clostridium manihotivorum TaxID=2320868 RepID=A0A3R5UBQ8_9CLOT|nr:N-acetylmuramoyl-L-alanine amidase [Clostridium manihotivorum]
MIKHYMEMNFGMIDLVLDAGHGGRDPGAIGPTGLQEKECNLYIAKKCEEILKKQGITVQQTRADDSYIGLSERAKIANDANSKYFISIHINSADIQTANGTEVYSLVKGGEGEKLAQRILSSMVNEINLSSRGVKFANFAVLRETNMPAILIETCFISNVNEERLLREDSFKDKVALSISKGFLDYIGISYKEDVSVTDDDSKLTPLIAPSQASKDQGKQWAKNNGGTELFISLADLYWSMYSAHGNINPTIAYAQAALETGYGKFGGSIDESFKNPTGIKSTSARDDSADSYVRFKSWKDGVSAHLDHLALYAGADGYPIENTTDPRHFAYLNGKVKYVEELSGNWSASQDYGLKLLKLINDIEGVTVVDKFEDSNIYEDSIIEEKSEEKETIKAVKDKLLTFSEEIDNLKTKYQEFSSVINDLDKMISYKDSENERLLKENGELMDKVKQYGEVIDDILNIINTRAR